MMEALLEQTALTVGGVDSQQQGETTDWIQLPLALMFGKEVAGSGLLRTQLSFS